MKKIAIAAFILLAILSPSFPVLAKLPQMRGEDLILMLILLSFIFSSSPRRTAALVPSNPVTRAFVLMGAMALISICSSTFIFDSELIINDWMILPMLFRYWLIFRIAQSLADYRSRFLCLGALLVAVILSSVVGILQYYNMLGINNWLTPLYVNEANEIVSLKMVIQGAVGARIAGTNGDPRYYGYLLVIGIGLCVSLLLEFPHRRWRKIIIATLGTIIVALAFTLSRTTILSGILVICLAVWLHQQAAKNASRALNIIFLLVFLGSVLSFAYKSESFEERVMDTHTSSFEKSWSARVRDLQKPFWDAYENPAIWLTGRGPAKAEMRTDSHNDFSWYFHRFGLPGLFFYILLFYYATSRSFMGYRMSSSPLEKAIHMTTLLVTVNWAVFAMAENIFKDPQLMAVNMLFLGLLYPVHTRATSALYRMAGQHCSVQPGRMCFPMPAVHSRRGRPA